MSSIGEILLSLAVKASVILIAALLLTIALRRASASTRRLVWIAAAACLLMLPVLSLTLPPLRTAWAPMPTLPVAMLPSATVTVHAAAASAQAPPKPLPWIPMLWVAGMLGVLGRLIVGIARVSWLVRTAEQIDPPEFPRELAARARFVVSHRIAMPMTCGVIHPAILLPENSRQWPAERLRLVVAHELIHVRDRDCLMQILMQLACALYWFHPLMWLAAAQFRKERERACDDGVLELGVSGPEYAAHLLELVRTMKPGVRPAMAVAMAHQSHLESRLVALLDAKINRKQLSRRATALAALAAACVALSLSSVRAQVPNAPTSISGFVYDASGAVIPRATVQATNLETHTKATVLAGQAGEYSLALSPGRYALEISTPGFRVFRRDNVNVSSGNQRVDAILELGAISERLEVVGEKPAGQVARSVVPRRIRVGGNVIAAKLVSRVAPAYPEHARQQGIEGAVLLQAIISKEGNVLSLTVVTTADPDLANAAMAAVQQWHYEPTLLNGQPVEVVTTITVDFKLN